MTRFEILNFIESAELELLKAQALHTNILENYFAEDPQDEVEKMRIVLQHKHYELINDILGDYLNSVFTQLRELEQHLTAEEQNEKLENKRTSFETALNMLKDKDGNVPECHAKAVEVLEKEKMKLTNTNRGEAHEASEIDIKSEL